MDLVTQLQNKVQRLTQLMGSTAGEVPQIHAPPAAPEPPEGVDPFEHYQRYWAERKEKYPFKTLGFAMSSEIASNNPKSWEDKGSEIRDVANQIKSLIQSDVFQMSEEDLNKELEQVISESASLDKDLKELEVQASTNVQQLRNAQSELTKDILQSMNLN